MESDIRALGIQLIHFSSKSGVRRPAEVINAGATMIHGVTPNVDNLGLTLAALESAGAPDVLLERVIMLTNEEVARLYTSKRR